MQGRWPRGYKEYTRLRPTTRDAAILRNTIRITCSERRTLNFVRRPICKTARTIKTSQSSLPSLGAVTFLLAISTPYSRSTASRSLHSINSDPYTSTPYSQYPRNLNLSLSHGFDLNLISRVITLSVASSDLGDKWSTSPKLVAEIDYVMSNIHPFSRV